MGPGYKARTEARDLVWLGEGEATVRVRYVIWVERGAYNREKVESGKG